MSVKKQEAFVVPKMLIWARETRGLSLEDSAKKLGIETEKLQLWETGEGRPTLRKLEKIVNLYKRPSAIFYLKKVPQSPTFPKDFRRLPEEQKTHPSPDTLLAIRRAKRVQTLYRELSESLKIEQFKKHSDISLKNNPESLANRMRKQLNASIPTQIGWKNEIIALEEWKKLLERQGILVLELRFPINEGRGFSISSGQFPVIVLNLNDARHGRIFTLFHEYAHILLGKGGICNWKESGDPEIKNVEVFSNSFSGNFLVPTDPLKENIDKLKGLELGDILKNSSKTFVVSKNVILRRLLTIGLINKSVYEKEEENLSEEFKELEKLKKFGRRSWAKEYFNANGRVFSSVVLEAFSGDIITFNDVSDYLNVKVKYIPIIERFLHESIST